MSGPKSRIHVSLPDKVVRDIDELVGPRKRSQYIADAVEAAAKKDRLLKVLYETAGTLDVKKYPYWSTPEKVEQWLRDLRETPSLRHDPIEDVIARPSARRKRSNRLAKRPARSS
jgi:Arc/MetJ-type ribon-helix-helix transcriptional regulator